MKAQNSLIHTPRVFNWIALFLGVLFWGLSAPVETLAQSRSAGNYWGQRSAQREASRWTLEEWLAQKDRNAMMDLWLAFNQSSPYEFTTTLTYVSYKLNNDDGAGTLTEKSNVSNRGQLQAYASIFGLAFEHEHNIPENSSENTGLFQLRLLGDSLQNTHLTAFYGLRTKHYAATTTDAATSVEQNVAGIELQMYLAKYFGVRGEYRQNLKTENAVFGDVSGSQSEAGLFIDFGPVRVFGDWYQEKESRKNTTTLIEKKVDRSGIKSGLKIFF